MAAMMAADLQDHPDVLHKMIEQIDNGYHVVWAVREAREGIKAVDSWLSHVFHATMQRILNQKDIPATGADFFVIRRNVVDVLCGFREANANVFALIQWMGFRQATVNYVKRARERGRSGWSLSKRIKLFIDSIVGFSYFPIRLVSLAGLITGLAGFVYAIVVLLNYIYGAPAVGWSSMMVAVLVIGGLNLTGMGLLGEYIWRALDEIRGRPSFIIEATFGEAQQGSEAGTTCSQSSQLQLPERGATL
jgi:dolichol-phosphate mannosyltransferase